MIWKTDIDGFADALVFDSPAPAPEIREAWNRGREWMRHSLNELFKKREWDTWYCYARAEGETPMDDFTFECPPAWNEEQVRAKLLKLRALLSPTVRLVANRRGYSEHVEV